MQTPTPLQRRNLENHHAFTALHRGEVARHPGFVRWSSTLETFRCVLLEASAAVASLPPGTRAVRTFPWSAAAEPTLEALGFQKAGGLRYMVLAAERVLPANVPAGLEVRVAEDEAELARFSHVQSRGFASPGDDLEGLHRFLHAANLRNLGHPAQTFYVGHLDGEPVAVTLLLVHEGAAGIYAVATLPESRRRGFSRALLARAVADARQRGCDAVTLQVHRDSNAERLYQHLGFQTDFDCTLWDKASG